MHEGRTLNYDSTRDNERDESLLKNLAALPKSMQPEHDVWQEISRRIANQEIDAGIRNNSSRRGWLALAASLMLMAISSVFMMNGFELSTPANQPTAEVKSNHLPLNEAGARVPANSLEREYQAAFREFVRLDLVRAGSPGLDREAIQQDWQLMQQLEQELKAALELEPENPWLAHRLLKLRAHQLQLLRVIADTGPSPGRNLI